MVYVREEFAQMEKSSKYPTEYYRCSINYSMGILLRSYTRAINKQENFSGSLFKSHTKAKCINYSEGFSPNFYKTVYGNMINVNDDMESYSQTCFDYIHNNPVKSGLVMKPSDWEFSSAREYLRLTTKPLVCQERAKEFGLVMG
jgi:putative transposase